MQNDEFSLLDIALLSLFPLLVWALDFLANSRRKRRRKLEYVIHPLVGGRFYWRRSEAEKDKNAFNI